MHNEYEIIVYQIIRSIPYGKVTSYGQIAKMAGKPTGARKIGYILKNLPEDTKLPWYRVVNSQGKISLTGDDYKRQYECLLKEGVTFIKVTHGYKVSKTHFIDSIYEE